MTDTVTSAIPAEEFGYGMDLAGLDMASLGEALRAIAAEAMADPARLATWSTEVALADQAIGMTFLRRLAEGAGSGAAAPPGAGDKRFADRAWRDNPFLASVLEGYLVRARAALRLVEDSALPEMTRRKARFAMSILTDALAPSNVPWLNPAVVKEAVDSGGASLARGMQSYVEDLATNNGMPRQVDATAFRVGENLGVTPGRVVFRNALIEVLAYEPQTERVHATPLLCSPPWINKYYIMDLAPGRSFVEWALRHGHQTFMISYRNPDASLAGYGMDDYLRDGVLAAIDAVTWITGAPRVNLFSLCLGGTMSAIALAYLAATGAAERVGWATFTNALVDFTEPGDLGVFTDESTIARLEAKMNERGYLEADEMARTFDWLRANDLVWSYVVNNWFLGKSPPAFDILSWNGDSTRMPAKMHAEYLRSCYLENRLVRPGAYAALGVPLDLGAIRTPLYVLGAENDHIAPWRSTYAFVRHAGGDDVTYTLTNAGHIAGIVNPPGGSKAVHWTRGPVADRTLDAEGWRAGAEQHRGSWWDDWAHWAEAHEGGPPSREPFPLPAAEPAPGRYVLDGAGPAVVAEKPLA